jgi:hypothetical protein
MSVRAVGPRLAALPVAAGVISLYVVSAAVVGAVMEAAETA